MNLDNNEWGREKGLKLYLHQNHLEGYLNTGTYPQRFCSMASGGAQAFEYLIHSKVVLMLLIWDFTLRITGVICAMKVDDNKYLEILVCEAWLQRTWIHTKEQWLILCIYLYIHLLWFMFKGDSNVICWVESRKEKVRCVPKFLDFSLAT